MISLGTNMPFTIWTSRFIKYFVSRREVSSNGTQKRHVRWENVRNMADTLDKSRHYPASAMLTHIACFSGVDNLARAEERRRMIGGSLVNIIE